MNRITLAKKLGIVLLSFGIVFSAYSPAVPAQAMQASLQLRAAGQTDQSLQITMKTYKHSYKTKEGKIYKKISYEYPVASGDSEAASTFNAFYQKQKKNWLKQAKSDLATAKEEIASFNKDDNRHYSDEVTCKISSTDETYLSILQTGYSNTLGAHGLPYRISYIFDVSTGEPVSPETILGLTTEQLNKKVVKLYLKKYDAQKDTNDMPFFKRKVVRETAEKMNFSQNCYIKNNSLRFYADPYSLGPYASGFIEVSLKFR